MDGDDAVLAHGAQLLVVGVDAVRHEGVVLPQAEFVIRLPVPRAAGAELAHPRDLVRALGEVRLDIEPALAGNLPEFCHELVGAAGSEARGDDGPHVFKPAPVQPADCLADRLLRCLLQNARQGVAVHIHLADIARDPGALKLLHKNPRRLGVQ